MAFRESVPQAFSGLLIRYFTQEFGILFLWKTEPEEQLLPSTRTLNYVVSCCRNSCCGDDFSCFLGHVQSHSFILSPCHETLNSKGKKQEGLAGQLVRKCGRLDKMWWIYLGSGLRLPWELKHQAVNAKP